MSHIQRPGGVETAVRQSGPLVFILLLIWRLGPLVAHYDCWMHDWRVGNCSPHKHPQLPQDGGGGPPTPAMQSEDPQNQTELGVIISTRKTSMWEVGSHCLERVTGIVGKNLSARRALTHQWPLLNTMCLSEYSQPALLQTGRCLWSVSGDPENLPLC